MRIVLSTLNSKFSHSSLALRYLEKYCAEFNPEVVELSINDNINTVYSRLLSKRAEVYCFSCYIWNIELIRKIAYMIKTAQPKSLIIFGGPQAKLYEFTDYLIIGEGEEGLFYLLSCIKKGDRPPKIIQRKTDITKIPIPYTSADIKGLTNKIIYFETSRGCPFNCSYCLSSIEHSVRYFPMEYVINGFNMFFKHKVPVVKLVDRTFNCNLKRAAEIVRYIVDNSGGTCVHLEIAPHLLNDELIDLFFSAPQFFKLELGIQSANNKTLKAVNRLFDLEKAEVNINRLKKCGVKMHIDLIAGLPYENYASFARSFDFVYSMQPDMLQLGFLKVLNNTAIKNFPGIWYGSFPPFEVLKTNWLSPYEVSFLKKTENAVDKFYNSGVFPRTIKTLTKNNSPFAVFEKLGKALSKEEEEGKLSRVKLYDLLYEFGGEKIVQDLTFDFLKNNKNAPLPRFIKRTAPAGYKTKFKRYIKENSINLKNNRIEPVLNKIIRVNFTNNSIAEITEAFLRD